MRDLYKIASFYRFTALCDLEVLKSILLSEMEKFDVTGTIIIAEEGYNGTVAAPRENLASFLEATGAHLGGEAEYNFSTHEEPGFKRRKVKIKKEIVTLKKEVSIELGAGTHVTPREWDALLNDPSISVIDARNDYEHQLGTFRGALNPETESFSELPDFIEKNFDPADNPKIAMFCTGGIRCEKLAPYLIEQGFMQVFQLEGGILNYLEVTDPEKSHWEGECFVFDERVTVDEQLKKGTAKDISATKKLSGKH